METPVVEITRKSVLACVSYAYATTNDLQQVPSQYKLSSDEKRNDWLTEIGMDGWTEGANFTQIDGGCGEEWHLSVLFANPLLPLSST